MSVADLEDLYSLEPSGRQHPFPAAIVEITSHLRTLVIPYAFTGMIAYGVHGRARMTMSIEILSVPERVGELRSARDLPVKIGHAALEVSVALARHTEDHRAITQTETHTLFGCDIYVSPARDLLWRLCRRDDLESQVLAIELLASCRIDVERLRAEMADEGAPDVLSRLDIAVNEAKLLPTRTYAASRARRRISEGARPKRWRAMSLA